MAVAAALLLALPVGAFAFFQATLQLQAYWKLDETMGPTAADAAGGFTATWVGGVTSSTDVPAPAGGTIAFGTSLRFTKGVAPIYLQAPSNATLDGISNGSYTVAAWVKPLSLPAGATTSGSATAS